MFTGSQLRLQATNEILKAKSRQGQFFKIKNPDMLALAPTYLCIVGFRMEEEVHQIPNQGHSSIWI